MSFLSDLQAAEKFVFSLFGTAKTVETDVAAVSTEVKSDPILSAAAGAAKTAVTTALTKNGIDASKVETVTSDVLSELSKVAAALPVAQAGVTDAAATAEAIAKSV